MYGKPLYPDSVVFMRRFGLFFGTVLQDLYKSPIHITQCTCVCIRYFGKRNKWSGRGTKIDDRCLLTALLIIYIHYVHTYVCTTYVHTRMNLRVHQLFTRNTHSVKAFILQKSHVQYVCQFSLFVNTVRAQDRLVYFS